MTRLVTVKIVNFVTMVVRAEVRIDSFTLDCLFHIRFRLWAWSLSYINSKKLLFISSSLSVGLKFLEAV